MPASSSAPTSRWNEHGSHRRSHPHVHGRLAGTAQDPRRRLQPADPARRQAGDLPRQHAGGHTAGGAFRLQAAHPRDGPLRHRHLHRLAHLPQRLLGRRGHRACSRRRSRTTRCRPRRRAGRPHPLVHLAALGVPGARGRRARAHGGEWRGRRDGAGQHCGPRA
ncbi:MAG: hypothetical protein MZW92_12210 [Comamonadaceae bacterium]|nr:hypothetical protein [Comamonadaceae bacterium]